MTDSFQILCVCVRVRTYVRVCVPVAKIGINNQNWPIFCAGHTA